MIDWLHDNWLAVSALIVAFVGGWPGILKVITHFCPYSLSGSVKFYAFTHSSAPPEDGILFGLSIINEGTKNLIWRKVKGKLKKIGTTIVVNPKMISTEIVVNNIKPCEQELLKQQSLSPSTAYNGYLLLTAPSGSLEKFNKTVFELHLKFGLESGKSVNVVLPVKGTLSVKSGENFPSHNVEF